MKAKRYPQKIALAISALLVGLGWPLASLAQVQKCVDPATGKVTFSDRGCSTGESTTAVRVRPANSIEGASYRQQASELTRPLDSPEPERRRTRLTIVGENNDADRQRQKLCKEASTPHKGARGLTAAQRAHAAQLCAGISLPIPATQSAPAPAPPAVITNCEPAGCWDSNGVWYTRGAGTTHIPTNGGHACQLIGGQMICP